MKQRILVAILLVLFFAPLIATPGFEPLTYVVFGCLNIMGAFELYRIKFYKKNKLNLPFILVSFLSSIVYIITTFLSGNIIPNLDNTTLVILTFIILLTIFFVVRINTCCMSNQKLFLQTIFYPSIGFGMVTNLRIENARYLLFVILVASLTDTFALFAGKLFGKHKLAPTISPKKTIEGAVLGTLFSSALLLPFFYFYDVIFKKTTVLNETFNSSGTAFLSFIPHYSLNHPALLVIFLFVLIVVLSIIGQVGDLYASKIKREFNIKDYSHIFLSHGGVLDRFDSLIFVSTAFMITLLICRLG